MARFYLVVALLALLGCSGSVAGRTLLQDSGTFSVAGMPGYIDFVKAGCHTKPFVEPGTGMWGASTDAKCQAYQTNNGKTSIVQFKLYGKDAIYFVYVPNAGVRINMLTCKGSTPSCSVDGEGGGPLKGTPVDVNCVANFVKYGSTCYKKKGADAKTCSALTAGHCSCAGVKCGTDSVTFGKIMTCKYGSNECNFIKAGTSATSG